MSIPLCSLSWDPLVLMPLPDAPRRADVGPFGPVLTYSDGTYCRHCEQSIRGLSSDSSRNT
jgi:hypothetical protein